MYLVSWVTPLLSWARSALKESGGLVWDKPSKKKKHWVTKCHLEIFLNVVFMIHFVIHLFVIVCFFPDLMSQDRFFFSECRFLSLDSSASLRTHFPWCHWLTDSRLSHGYFYINLPPMFMCLLPFVFMYVSKTKEMCCVTFLLFSLTKNTWPHRANLHAAVAERMILCESTPKWLTAHSCVCTLL